MTQVQLIPCLLCARPRRGSTKCPLFIHAVLLTSSIVIRFFCGRTGSALFTCLLGGHPSIDQVLEQKSREWQDRPRKSWVVARYLNERQVTSIPVRSVTPIPQEASPYSHHVSFPADREAGYLENISGDLISIRMLDDMIAVTTGLAMRNAFLKGERWRPVRKEAMKSVIFERGGLISCGSTHHIRNSLTAPALAQMKWARSQKKGQSKSYLVICNID